jgi:hypothetical protein
MEERVEYKANGFRKAVKHEAKLRMALIGPAGSGKTYSALNIAQYLGNKVALVDTEHGSASKYADIFTFDTIEPQTFHPQVYIDAIRAAEAGGYDVLIVDSLSHAWMGKDGALELVDKAAKRTQSGSTFAAWRDVTPLHHKLVDTMLACNLHLIVTMRSKTEYAVEKDEKGKTSVRKIGLAPVQRDGLEYEFDVTGDLDLDNNLIVSKTRCPALKGAVIPTPGKDLADTLKAWLSGAPPPPTEGGASGNGHGKTITRQNLIARLTELADESAQLGQPVEMDPSWLTETPVEQLIQAGLDLRMRVDALKAATETVKLNDMLSHKPFVDDEVEQSLQRAFPGGIGNR